jgi:Phosphotransferase enzyme family
MKQAMVVHHTLPHDPALPYLGVALEPTQMQGIFQALLFDTAARQADPARYNFPEKFCTTSSRARPSGLPGQNFSGDLYQVDSCVIERVKYKAQEKCVVSYRLHILDLVHHSSTEQRFCARLFPVGQSLARYRKALQEPLVQPRYGQAVMHLAELDMVLWAFPNDRKIAGLPHLLATAAHTNGALDELAITLCGAGSHLVDHHYTVVHYVPEHTCTVRVQLQIEPPASTAQPLAQRAITLFGKAYYNTEGAESYRLMHLLWTGNANRGDRPLRIAQPIAYDPATQILWQMGLPGRTLLTYALGSTEFTELLGEAARAVALLHRADLPCLRTTPLQSWVEQLQGVQALLNQVRPQMADAVDQVVTALIERAPLAGNEPWATLHGDLHLQNFFVDEQAPLDQRVALIDLDNLSTGSPWRDLGSFCAALYYRALLENLPMPLIRQAIDTFCTVYACQVPWPMPPPLINWYTAAALVNERAFRTVTRLKEGRLDLLDDLIRLASELVVE